MWYVVRDGEGAWLTDDPCDEVLFSTGDLDEAEAFLCRELSRGD